MRRISQVPNRMESDPTVSPRRSPLRVVLAAIRHAFVEPSYPVPFSAHDFSFGPRFLKCTSFQLVRE